MDMAEVELGNGAVRVPHVFKTYTRGERIADGAVHILGVLASVVSVTILIVLAVVWRDAATVWSVSIYGAGTIAVFVISAAYHLTPVSPLKTVLRRFDHAAIFVKIAGTYTPLAAISIGGGWGMTLLILVWGIAAVGVALKLGGWRGGEKISVALYLAQGWLVVLAIKPLMAALTGPELLMCALGGGIYTIGTLFYLMPRMPYNNAIWHGLVLTASGCFYVGILMAVVLR